MKLANQILQTSQCTLLLAPPGWGKTSLLIELYQKNVFKMIFVSPLKALALEFYQRLEGLPGIFMPKSFAELETTKELFFEKKFSLMVVTAELLRSDFIGELKEKSPNTIFILDEFHLFYYWGDDFRPWLLELWMNIINYNFSILCLTATLSHHLMNRWKDEIKNNLDQGCLIDLGEGRFFRCPEKIYYYGSSGIRRLRRRFIYDLFRNKNDTFLYFCSYRKEVEHWIEFCHRYKIPALGCRGGETQKFMQQLKECSTPRCIFSTSALSHGVNLPAISKVYLGYEIANRDFWLQMAGRGGRQGQAYQVHSLEGYFLEGMTRKKNIFITHIFDVFIRLCVL